MDFSHETFREVGVEEFRRVSSSTGTTRGVLRVSILTVITEGLDQVSVEVHPIEGFDQVSVHKVVVNDFCQGVVRVGMTEGSRREVVYVATIEGSREGSIDVVMIEGSRRGSGHLETKGFREGIVHTGSTEDSHQESDRGVSTEDFHEVSVHSQDSLRERSIGYFYTLSSLEKSYLIYFATVPSTIDNHRNQGYT